MAITEFQVTRYRDDETGEEFDSREAAERAAVVRSLTEKIRTADVYMYDVDTVALAGWLFDNFDMTPKVKP